jgi:hypothetical protein
MIGPEFVARLERRALLLAIAMAAVAFAWPSGGANAAAGVLGGALIAAINYLGIRRGVDTLIAAASGGTPARGVIVRALIILVGRYALLAVIAYVMISRLRLRPLGVLMGVSVIPLTVAIEAMIALAGSRKTVRGDHGKT